jgi:uncharacterized protein YlxW (UPF0749 family)
MSSDCSIDLEFARCHIYQLQAFARPYLWRLSIMVVTGPARERGMAGDSSVMAALQKLEQALSALDDAIERREDEERRSVDVETELHRVGADRSRLAQALDAAEAKAARLEETNREVSRRLVAAMESIRGVIERNKPSGQ